MQDYVLIPRTQLDYLLNIAAAIKQDELLTIKQAAAYLRTSVVTFWKVRKSSNIRAVLSNKKLLFRKSDLDDYLAKNVSNDCNSRK
jgi:excisionase family DNA binding protein